ncbi:hypothetical protein NIES2135_61890 (plasmid) [Leptolyngbya boryana NIES-2135]|uniref:Uncharacterized protein n=1 Tax=Leptolyngbya boryana NIES-2135 TaxID=1973484 RepID=A0A1Z4JRF3_LEPBY|nr:MULTISPECIES: hypothetical protein [Leptolyngbya]ULP33503.1 hypothetical protein MCP04_30715 [Leptolyngbya boryana IU 594]BAY59312.1 hypothetical protein NIES2135_61890 [Leptolyngbya boryana NIES-2135]
MNPPEFRTVNRILDSRPRVGPIPADLIIPWFAIAVVFYTVLQGLLHVGYLWTGLSVAGGCATWWLLNGSRPYQFLSKFIQTPNWTRGYIRYQSLAAYRSSTRQRYEKTKSSPNSRKKKGRKTSKPR